MTDAKEKIMNLLKERGGKVKILTAFYVSECRLYSDFSRVVRELEKEGLINRTGQHGEYLEVRE